MSPEILSYQQTIEYLYALQKHGVKLGLANTVALMESLGNPHQAFPSIHVAGTNGKGSTSAFLASALQAAGFRVGLYTSPHLVSFTERIRVNGAAIAEEKVVELAQKVRAAYAQGSGREELNPTFFEVTTAAAFAYFAEQAVDIAVIETGMGGRLDATNVITPLVSIITTIDLEHTEFLGSTLDAIAAEKAGIIKAGIPVVTGVVQPEAIGVIRREAEARAARVYRLSEDFDASGVSAGGSGQRFDYHGIAMTCEGLSISLRGRHQVDNACLALAALECLRPAGFALGADALRQGLSRARWEGRLERVFEKPDLYLDGAHNPASAKKLALAVEDLKRTYRRMILVIGILGDKDVGGILSELLPLADEVIVTRPEYARAMDLDALAAEVKRLHGAVHAAPSVARAIDAAKQKASADDLILVTGSLYVVGDAKAALSREGKGPHALCGLKG